jgi:hypothetical protein
VKHISFESILGYCSLQGRCQYFAFGEGGGGGARLDLPELICPLLTESTTEKLKRRVQLLRNTSRKISVLSTAVAHQSLWLVESLRIIDVYVRPSNVLGVYFTLAAITLSAIYGCSNHVMRLFPCR